MIQCYYGNGKGKTTAAVGQALRMAGAGKKVMMIQFLKDGFSSENMMLEKCGIKEMCIRDRFKSLWLIDKKHAIIILF